MLTHPYNKTYQLGNWDSPTQTYYVKMEALEGFEHYVRENIDLRLHFLELFFVCSLLNLIYVWNSETASGTAVLGPDCNNGTTSTTIALETINLQNCK